MEYEEFLDRHVEQTSISLPILPFLLYPEYAAVSPTHIVRKTRMEDRWGLYIEM